MSDTKVDAEQGVVVAMRGRIVRFYPLSWAALRRTRPQREVIYGRKAAPLSEEWEEAVFVLLFESATANGDIMTRDEFAEALTQQNQAACFKAMVKAATVNMPEVVDDGKEHPTSSLNGTGSTLSLSAVPDGGGPTATS